MAVSKIVSESVAQLPERNFVAFRRRKIEAFQLNIYCRKRGEYDLSVFEFLGVYYRAIVAAAFASTYRSCGSCAYRSATRRIYVKTACNVVIVHAFVLEDRLVCRTEESERLVYKDKVDDKHQKSAYRYKGY